MRASGVQKCTSAEYPQSANEGASVNLIITQKERFMSL